LRNYLTGLLWMRTENITWSETVWLPDDFGHDSQLPVLLDALGAKAVGISRLPSSCGSTFDFFCKLNLFCLLIQWFIFSKRTAACKGDIT
jgi:hypothetical protein